MDGELLHHNGFQANLILGTCAVNIVTYSISLYICEGDVSSNDAQEEPSSDDKGSPSSPHAVPGLSSDLAAIHDMGSSSPDVSLSLPSPADEHNDIFVRRSTQSKIPNTRLRDYVCYTTRVLDLAFFSPVPPLSSGVPYHIANFVTCAHFSANHSHFLAVITTLTEPISIERCKARLVILVIEISRGPTGLFLDQRKYTLDILAETDLLGEKLAQSPIDQNHCVALDDGTLYYDPERYRRFIGRLIYLTITRLELCNSVHVLAQFMQCPREIHWEAVIRVLHYLKGHLGRGIDSTAIASSSCPLTYHSLTSYFIFLGGSPISWKTKKQHTVSRSSTEVEYQSMAVTSCELTLLKALLKSLDVSYFLPMHFYCDSQAVLHITTNPVFHERTKHIEIDCHYVRDQIHAGNITVSHVCTYEQLADIFTKALGRHQFENILCKLGIRDHYAPT
ncbi:hypothetical protein KPL71_012150 [Citrus sinensis]|uniref:Uncharacterized protein n=1 Tax=Citrus sinensis TaxID=2711 RepID=A0ACB8L937_CITSI|nr:hypothetical protein KPL71_012150 [Citrus sinensis]